MSFAELNLNPILIERLQSTGFSQPRPIQAQAINPLREGRDVIGLAETGSGKTIAFLAPLLHRLLADKPKERFTAAQRLRGLVLCPTRELAQQVAAEAESLARGSVIRVGCVYGKVSMGAQTKMLADGVDLLVATPGRVRELLDAEALSLSRVQSVVIDEADRLLDMGFLPQIELILQRMPKRTQTALFTATFPPKIEQLAERYQKSPVRIEIGEHTTPVEHVTQRLVMIDDAQKIPLLLKLIREEKRKGVLIFCATRRRVGWVASALKRNDISCASIHGDRSQAQRQRALADFTKGDVAVLVATDVAARGLHVERVKTVVNYDVPAAAEEYVHRIGRAGHGAGQGGGSGEAVTLLTHRDHDAWERVEQTVDVTLAAEIIDGFEPKPQHSYQPPGDDHAPQRGGKRRKRKTDKKHVYPDAITKRGRIKRRKSKSRPLSEREKSDEGVIRKYKKK